MKKILIIEHNYKYFNELKSSLEDIFEGSYNIVVEPYFNSEEEFKKIVTNHSDTFFFIVDVYNKNSVSPSGIKFIEYLERINFKNKDFNYTFLSYGPLPSTANNLVTYKNTTIKKYFKKSSLGAYSDALSLSKTIKKLCDE